MKRRLSLAISFLLALTLLAGCTSPAQSPAAPAEATAAQASAAPQPAGEEDTQDEDVTYRTLYASEVTTLNYLATGNTAELAIAANFVDALVEYDSFGLIIPSLAESWQSNDDFTQWTFTIRQGVKWVDKDGNEVADVTAHDWVSAAHYVNDAFNDTGQQYMYADNIVKNAEEYYDQSADVMAAEDAVAEGTFATVEEYYTENEIDPATFIDMTDIGVEATDDYTLVYTCGKSVPYFLTVLSFACYFPVYGPYLEQLGADFGVDNENLLYNGAYILSTFEPQNRRVLTKNPKYWDVDNVHITAIEAKYNAEELTLAPTMFTRGEVDSASVTADILDQWLKDDATKDLVRGQRIDNSYSYFFAFNFEPRFDAAYEPDNWTKAVNNENFRQSLMSALDRVKALAVSDPYKPEARLNNTITPANFATAAGKDFVDYPGVSAHTALDSFDAQQAIAYRDFARQELEADGATFPIKVLMPFNPTTTNWDKECQVIEQQLEGLLGSDFIDIIVEAGPATGFLSEIRRSGKFALMKCNWGADYADPQTWTDPFSRTNSYNFMYSNADKVLSDIPATNKGDVMMSTVAEYYQLIDEAKAITTDGAARYDAFARAEGYLIDRAIVIPYALAESNYIASRLNPFEGQFAPYGYAQNRYKGQTLLDVPMSMTQFDEAYAQWQIGRDAAIAQSGA